MCRVKLLKFFMDVCSLKGNLFQIRVVYEKLIRNENTLQSSRIRKKSIQKRSSRIGDDHVITLISYCLLILQSKRKKLSSRSKKISLFSDIQIIHPTLKFTAFLSNGTDVPPEVIKIVFRLASSFSICWMNFFGRVVVMVFAFAPS